MIGKTTLKPHLYKQESKNTSTLIYFVSILLTLNKFCQIDDIFNIIWKINIT